MPGRRGDVICGMIDMDAQKEWVLRVSVRDRYTGRPRELALEFDDRRMLDNQLAVFSEFYVGTELQPGRLHVFRNGDDLIAFVEECYVSHFVEH